MTEYFPNCDFWLDSVVKVHSSRSEETQVHTVIYSLVKNCIKTIIRLKFECSSHLQTKCRKRKVRQCATSYDTSTSEQTSMAISNRNFKTQLSVWQNRVAWRLVQGTINHKSFLRHPSNLLLRMCGHTHMHTHHVIHETHMHTLTHFSCITHINTLSPSLQYTPPPTLT